MSHESENFVSAGGVTLQPSLYGKMPCQNKCRYCFQYRAGEQKLPVRYPDQGATKPLKSLDWWEEFVASGKLDMFAEKHLSGTEITISVPKNWLIRFVDIIDRTYTDADSTIWMSTNARVIGKDEEYAFQLKGAGVHGAQVTLNAFREHEVHDQTQGVNGAFRQTLAGIRNFQKAGVSVVTNTLMTVENVYRPGGIAQIVKEIYYEVHPDIVRVSQIYASPGRGEKYLNEFGHMLSLDVRRKVVEDVKSLGLPESALDFSQALDEDKTADYLTINPWGEALKSDISQEFLFDV